MTTRDPRSRVPLRPTDTGGHESAREPTQSLSIELDSEDVDPSHPSLAMGTSGDRTSRTKIESPSGRYKTPPPKSTKPPPVPARGTEDPENRLNAVLGAYRLVELLGKGGMGYVYRAEHVKLGREVALKLLRGDYAKRRDAVLRFFQEAKTVNRVRHRNIVDVTDFVELDDGTTFIIMEFLRGQSLGKWARTGIDLPRALAVLVQICDGLGAAHAVGVVHRDLKPDNVIVVPTSDGAELVKLLDFGVAKLLNRDDEDVGFQTAAGSVIGTPAYMSPEQAGGMAVDHRSDIYSLGAIMYELFCGQPMFRGRSFGEYVRKHLTEIPIPPRQTQNGASIDPALEALIVKCLSKDPNERFSHILELRDGLLHLLGGGETNPPGYLALTNSSITRPPPTMSGQLPPHMLPLAPPMVTTQPTPSVPHSQASQISHLSSHFSHYSVPPDAQREPATPWWVWTVGGAVAVALGIGGALWFANQGEEPAPVAAKPAPQPRTAPTTAPIQAPPAPAKLVELKFDSLPSAGVYADGRSAELCRTPCSFNVDLADGGPTDHRTFVLRVDGYKDKRVTVDFAATQRDFSSTLERIPPVPTVPAVTQAPVEETSEPAETKAETVADKGEKTSSKRGSGKKAKRSARGETVETKPETTAEVKAEEKKTETKPVNDTILEPVEKKSAKKPAGTIDPSDTIDPFRH